MKTIDYKFSELCDEIDYWKSEAKYYKAELEKSRKEHMKVLDDSIMSSKKMVGTLLTATLDPDSVFNKDSKVLDPPE